MPHRKSILAGLAAAGLFASMPAPASAADLDYGDAPPPPEAEQKVEFGSGWYIRGDMAFTQDNTVSTYQPPNSTIFYSGLKSAHNPGYDLSIGGGYALTNSFRGDVTADFHQPFSTTTYNAYCYNSSVQTCTSTGQFRSYDALVNAYYDFGVWHSITPYVGAGVGVAFGEFSSGLTGGAQAYGGAFGYHNLAWALMGGIAIDVFDHTKIDIGYRYLDNGSVTGLHLRYNEIRAGVRYMLDN